MTPTWLALNFSNHNNTLAFFLPHSPIYIFLFLLQTKLFPSSTFYLQRDAAFIPTAHTSQPNELSLRSRNQFAKNYSIARLFCSVSKARREDTFEVALYFRIGIYVCNNAAKNSSSAVHDVESSSHRRCDDDVREIFWFSLTLINHCAPAEMCKSMEFPLQIGIISAPNYCTFDVDADMLTSFHLYCLALIVFFSNI